MTRKIKQYGPKWKKFANQLARDYAPPISTCATCSYPVLTGYCCTFCGEVDTSAVAMIRIQEERDAQIRRAALEDAAKKCQQFSDNYAYQHAGMASAAETLAGLIRDMKEAHP